MRNARKTEPIGIIRPMGMTIRLKKNGSISGSKSHGGPSLKKARSPRTMPSSFRSVKTKSVTELRHLPILSA